MLIDAGCAQPAAAGSNKMFSLAPVLALCFHIDRCSEMQNAQCRACSVCQDLSMKPANTLLVLARCSRVAWCRVCSACPGHRTTPVCCCLLAKMARPSCGTWPVGRPWAMPPSATAGRTTLPGPPLSQASLLCLHLGRKARPARYTPHP